jgi:hypothetical protein
MKHLKKTRFSVLVGFLIAICFFGLQTVAFAQEKLATFEGVVTDPEDAGLPGAEVALKNTETGYAYATVTRPDGRFQFSGIEPGQYEFTVKLDGFNVYGRKGMTLNVGARVSLTIKLTPATLEQEVTVVADAPLVEVTKSEISSVVGRKEIDDLPVVSRSFAQLAILKAGTAGSGSDIRSGGQPAGSSEILVDGVSNEFSYYNTMRSDLPADAIQEFRVLVNQFSAEYGNATAVVLHAITRSGTNEFRGRAYGFYRDEALDAKNYFATEKEAFSQYRFGGFLGGPIIKDKLHFFASYEGARNKTYSVITSPLVPLETVSVKNVNDQGLFKLNYQLNEKNMLSFRYTRDYPRGINQGVGGYNTRDLSYDSIQYDNVFQGNWTFYPTDNTMNELRAQYSYRWMETKGNDMSGSPDNYQIYRPSGNFGKYWGNPMTWPEKRFQVNDNFNIFLDKHSLKMGFDINDVDSSVTNMWGSPGMYYFSTDDPFDPALEYTYPTRFRWNAAAPSHEHSHMTSYGFFFQDSWKVVPRLTLNLGLRYSIYKFEQNPNQERFVVSNKWNWDPRLGFSWDPVGDGRTAIRGGVGKYTNSPMGNVVYASVMSRVEYDERILYFPGYPDPLVPNPFRPSSADDTPKENYTFEKGMPCPTSMQYTLGIERELMKDLSLSADFVISKGVHEYWFVNKNPILLGTGSVRADPTMGNWYNMEAGGHSNYSALYLVLKKRYSHGFGLEVSYTLSKSKADVESGDWNTASNDYDRSLDYGPINDDARHRLSLTGVVDLPLGFQLSTIFYYRSALPYSITLGYDANGDGIWSDYPGTAHRNSGRGPDYYSLDARVSKFVNLGDRFSVQIFAEMFNLTNRVNYYNPDGDMGSSNFGKYSSAMDPRLIQFGVRFNF